MVNLCHKPCRYQGKISDPSIIIKANVKINFGDEIYFFVGSEKMNELEKVRADVQQFFESEDWVKWIHEGSKPAYNNDEKNINIALVGKHCSICLNLNGCCFPRSKMPKQPLHPKCHCLTEQIPKPIPHAECRLSKFTGFIFHPNPINNKGKKVLFEG